MNYSPQDLASAEVPVSLGDHVEITFREILSSRPEVVIRSQGALEDGIENALVKLTRVVPFQGQVIGFYDSGKHFTDKARQPPPNYQGIAVASSREIEGRKTEFPPREPVEGEDLSILPEIVASSYLELQAGEEERLVLEHPNKYLYSVKKDDIDSVSVLDRA